MDDLYWYESDAVYESKIEDDEYSTVPSNYDPDDDYPVCY